MNDPHKSNALIFHPDGRMKTLHERGLGINDPPLKPMVPQLSKVKRVPVPKLKELMKGVNAKSNKSVNAPTKKAVNTVNAPAPVNAPTKPQAARKDMAAYMRKRRADAKAAKAKT